MGKLNLNALKGKQDAAPESGKGDSTVVAGSSSKPAAGLAFLKNRQQPQQLEEKQEAAPAPATAASSGGLAFLKQQTQQRGAADNSDVERVASDSGDATESLASGLADGGRGNDRGADGDSGGAGGAGDLDLAGLLDSSTGGSAPVKSRFNDEIPADTPIRELPEDLDKQAKAFIESLNSVYKVVHEPDLLGGVVKNIMMELGQNPEYRKLISPMDVHVMIKGMRDSMGMARIKKEESKAKRTSSKKAKNVKVDDLDALAALDEAFRGVEI